MPNTLIDPPDKLSALIKLAIEGASKLDRGVYEPNSGRWHEPWSSESHNVWMDPDYEKLAGKCMICLAGGVMAGTLGVGPSEYYNTSSPENRKWRDALNALDHARVGDWITALAVLQGIDTAVATLENRLQVLALYAVDECRDHHLQLGSLERPTHSDFSDWPDFDLHLSSMKDRAEKLETLGF